MSSSFYLLLLLLSLITCIAFQPCYFQSLQLADDKFQKKLQAPIKGKMGKMIISWDKEAIECMKLSTSKAIEERSDESIRSKRSKYKKRKKQLKRVEKLKKVSWKVVDDQNNHKKLKGNNGVFSSDYEHARTHPPSHN